MKGGEASPRGGWVGGHPGASGGRQADARAPCVGPDMCVPPGAPGSFLGVPGSLFGAFFGAPGSFFGASWSLRETFWSPWEPRGTFFELREPPGAFFKASGSLRGALGEPFLKRVEPPGQTLARGEPSGASGSLLGASGSLRGASAAPPGALRAGARGGRASHCAQRLSAYAEPRLGRHERRASQCAQRFSARRCSSPRREP